MGFSVESHLNVAFVYKSRLYVEGVILESFLTVRCYKNKLIEVVL